MLAKVNINVGGVVYQFEFDNQTEMEAMHRAIAISNYPTYCNICKKEADKNDLKLTTNKDKDGNIYINLKHNNCDGKVKLGVFKQGGYFWHRDFEIYKKRNENNSKN